MNNMIKIIGLFIIVFFLFDAVIGFFLTKGLEKYYGLYTNSEIALVGHSHLMLGVNKTMLEKELGGIVSKYTRPGVNVADRLVMIQQLLKQNSKLKIIIYGVDAWTFTGEGLSANSFKLFYPFMGSKEADAFVRNQAEIGDYWLHKLLKTSRFDEKLINSSFRGYLHNWSNLKFGQIDTIRLKKEIALGMFRKIDNSDDNVSILRQSIREMNKHGIKVILLYVPTIDLYNNTEPEKFTESLEIIKHIENEFSNVKFLNYLEPLSHDYSLFFDRIHMNPKGQELVTRKLIKDLDEIDKNGW